MKNSPHTLGATVVDDGIIVAVHAPDAEAVAVCLFDIEDREIRRERLHERSGGVHYGHVAGVRVGARYGLRAYGPWNPASGLRFNGSKLLMDPWATAIDRPFTLHPWLFDRERPRPEDTAALMPKAIVETPVHRPATNRPAINWDRQVIYELHVRGFTQSHPDIPDAIRGTYAALAHPAAIAHLLGLGITTVEIMPSAAWVDERHLPPLNLTNYWGYNPVAFLAPDPRLAPGGWAEVRATTDALHAAGLNVILDVVLNHSGESDELGPTLSLRGLDNAGYYRAAADRSLYVNDAGCGNVLAMDRPMPMRLGMDALRAWALFGGFDGFRLDLAATLARRDDGFDRNAPFLAAVEQDPHLSRCLMIAEPWDIGPGGYQLGSFPARWGEWNDRFRNHVRRFWRGDRGMLGAFATSFAGSADVFHKRPLTRSINYITAHDGFTLADLVSYKTKQNHPNGEDNRDGSHENFSWNNGVEGPSNDLAVAAARLRDIRALLATLLLSRGTPMVSMGDELGRTQHGNNNAYAQDNASSWISWAEADETLVQFTAQLLAFRRELAPLFDGRPLQGEPIDSARLPDVAWLTVDGGMMTPEDWGRADNHTLIAVLFAAETRAALVFHADTKPIQVTLPTTRPGYVWRRILESSEATSGSTIPGRSVVVFREHTEGDRLTSDIAETKALFGSKSFDHQPDVLVVDNDATALIAKTAFHRSHPPGDDAMLARLAELAGINSIWWDIGGGQHKVTPETKRVLLRAMRLPAATPGDLKDSLARVARQPSLPWTITVRVGTSIPVQLGKPRPAWVTLLREDGSLERFNTRADDLLLPPQPIGWHRLLDEDRPDHACYLTVAPATCHLPNLLLNGKRCFGIAAHLYALRSAGDQGVGDFTTLARFSAAAVRSGASMIGLNPLHALFPTDRDRASPYHPSDRRFLDPMYIDVSNLPGGIDLPSAPGPVDYPAVWQRKRAVLKAAFQSGVADPIPEALWGFATFSAIAETLGSSAWHTWPDGLRHPDSPDVEAFAARHREEVRFHAFMQDLADGQLAAAATAAKRDGLSLGFYRDLAVGAAPDGAEVWAAQDSLMQGVSVGAPPDPFSATGQVWCLPPPDPVAMRLSGFRAFNTLLSANMRHAGALRIDHVMGLRRLFVVPDGATAADGAYVTYPLDDLLGQLALQSQRAQCLVVGEDLGTVPEGMSEALAASNILSYSVLWFERRNGRIRPAAEWRRLAAACVSTHDLPTLAGWWDGVDIAEKQILSLLAYPGAEAARMIEKAELVEMLRQEKFLLDDVDLNQPLPPVVAAAVHAFVSATPALLALIQADDLVGETIAVNLPGTDRERPNWRRRLSPDVSDIFKAPLARAILAAMNARSV